MSSEDPNPFVLDPFVGGRCDDLAIVLRDHDPAIKGVLSRVVAPGDEPTDGLGDLVEPRSPGSRVERCQRSVVAGGGVAQDHLEERWTRVADVRGVHVLDGVGVAVTRRPLARLRSLGERGQESLQSGPAGVEPVVLDPRDVGLRDTRALGELRLCPAEVDPPGAAGFRGAQGCHVSIKHDPGTQESPATAGDSLEYPQRDSNPCRHLERVVS